MNTIKVAAIAGLFATLAAGTASTSSALDNGLARTPPMGWNSWNCFGSDINETQIKAVADAMVSTGLKDAGYVYLNLDDNWMGKSRDADGNLQGDPTRFPKGMKELGDYIHSRGLKFGVYGDRGLKTCYFRDFYKETDNKSGSYMKEVQDAKSFASWGVDYLKYDNCVEAPNSNQQQDYERMRDALANCGREIVFSVCAWAFKDWAPKTGNLWRTTDDIKNTWIAPSGSWYKGILDIIDKNNTYASHAAPGAWNDPDMLQIGNYKIKIDNQPIPNDNEYRTHMSLWCIMAAPLIMGNDIRNMTQVTKDILLNTEVIAVNQDSAGIQGTKIKSANGLDVWCKPLGSKNGDVKAVALFNRNAATADITVNFSDIGFTGEAHVRDLWKKTDKGLFTGSFTMAVEPHNTAMLKIAKPTGIRTEQALLQQKKAQFSAVFTNGNIVVVPLNAKGQFDVSVFSSNGRMAAQLKNKTASVSLPVAKSGLYVVAIENQGYMEKKTVLISR